MNPENLDLVRRQSAQQDAEAIRTMIQSAPSVAMENQNGADGLEEYVFVANIPHSISQSSTAGSSLSGEDDAMPMDEEPPFENSSISPQLVIAERMNRSDSRSSHDRNSMNSGNWGWFEDVHSGGDLTPIDPKRKASNKRKSNGLIAEYEVRLTNMSDMTGLPSSSEESALMTAPNYVLEESISNQRLWKYTAGNRPPQPVEERAFYEKMWAQNFVRSNVDYQIPVDVLTAATPISLSPFADGNFEDNVVGAQHSNYNLAACDVDGNKNAVAAAEARLMSRMLSPANADGLRHNLASTHMNQNAKNKVKGSGSDVDLTVLYRGDNVFGTTVSKSFPYTMDGGSTMHGVDTVNISVASYRVVESKKHGKYAQFLVIYREGSIRDTIGVWKRYSDFKNLSLKVEGAHESCTSVIANMSPLHITEEPDVEHLPNAITSWRLLKKRQRWYRCLDAGYLSLKVFLLERFLHDILFESSSPKLLRDFVGKDVVSTVSSDDESY